ncbi:o-succinylbenzoate synthase [Oleiharenicola sp. Vm1]|uniref:o-succinylbenzoate synthase n=1 Tax=Oleiharenicola sp. Vm1 TaxID=3398393 RepID=UPI0039F4C14F
MSLRFSFRTYRRPLRAPLRTAHGRWTEREGLLLRAEAEDGTVRWGEVAPIPWFGSETLAEAREVCARLGDTLDASALAAVPERMGCVRFALANLREDNQAARPAPAAGLRLPVAALLPAGRAALAAAEAKLEAGFLAFKWKVGVERAEEEMPVLDDLLARLPGYAKLRLDANGAWSNRDATRWLEFCAERPVEFVEQPVLKTDTLLGLAEDYPVKLALDESVAHLAAAREWQARGWSGVFVVKPALAGPLDELVAWARATKPDLVLSSAIESALARAQILRTAFAEKLTERPLGFGVGEIFGERAWDGPAIGPLLDAAWGDAVDPEVLWNAAS